MTNPLTPSFPMENKKLVEEVSGKSSNVIVDEATKKAVDKIFKANLPQETSKNHVSVGGVGLEKDYSYSFYNPHNARYYFVFDKWNFNKNSLVGGGFEIINSSELLLKNYCGCRIVVKKKLIEITNKIDTKRLFKIDGSLVNRKLQVQEALVVLEKEVISVLRKFVSDFGGSTDFVVKKVWIPDNKILHDRLVDSLPNSLTWRDEVSKKVYLDEPKNVEISSPEMASNVFRNLALNDFSPEIASQIELLNKRMDVFESRALVPLTEQIVVHLEVQQETLKTLKAIRDSVSNKDNLSFLKLSIKCFEDVLKFKNEISLLSSVEKLDFEKWLIKSFGW